MSNLMPAVFFGHGNPMNALTRNSYTEGWSAVGRSVPRPKAILSISAHWYTPVCAVTINDYPPTIHDFGGFPKELYQMSFPAPGDPKLARRVQEMLSPLPVTLEEGWGLDHGTWAVLCHVFPEADVPVVQLSIDARQPPQFHYDVGRALAPLREEGVLMIGSGNIVHNLRAYDWENQKARPYDWAVRFEERLIELLNKGDDAPLIAYERLGRDAMLSIPTPDHYLPLLYILGLRSKTDRISYPVKGVDGGSVSMLAIQFGQPMDQSH